MDDFIQLFILSGVVSFIYDCLIVIFVVFICLFVKWLRRLQEGTTLDFADFDAGHQEREVIPIGDDTMYFADFDPSLQERALTSIHCQGLDPSVLETLPIMVFSEKEYKDGIECAVCLSSVCEGENARILPKCNHGFHMECIDMWLQSHTTCPLCRKELVDLSFVPDV